MVTFDKINFNGQLVAMETDDVGAEGGRGGAARAVGAGTLIGAAAGDAAAGAAVGAGLALLAGGKRFNRGYSICDVLNTSGRLIYDTTA
jgi:hypothetical protein